jgi:hypothetical protein
MKPKLNERSAQCCSPALRALLGAGDMNAAAPRATGIGLAAAAAGRSSNKLCGWGATATEEVEEEAERRGARLAGVESNRGRAEERTGTEAAPNRLSPLWLG